MYARCVKCKIPWNISIETKIPKEGYTCPVCDHRNKKQREVRQIENILPCKDHCILPIADTPRNGTGGKRVYL